ncbi:MAG: prefoldin subunit, partial [Candidatus Aenigmarchaeota archaeon]|nr:prefoldin subunit [Candidatus Aenigmarchaeota archaeon]
MNSKEKMKEESMDEFRKNMTTYETLVNGGMRFKKGSSVIQDGKPEIRYPTMGARQAAGYYVHCNPGHHFLVVYVQNGGEAQYFWEGDFMPEKKNLEDVVELLQVQNQQIQTLLMQKQALTMQSKEIEKTLEDLEKAGDDIYKSVGPILVK